MSHSAHRGKLLSIEHLMQLVVASNDKRKAMAKQCLAKRLGSEIFLRGDLVESPFTKANMEDPTADLRNLTIHQNV